MNKIKLAKWEIKLLPLSLATTERQAKSIVLRNERLLVAAKKNVRYRGRIGCPHCKLAGRTPHATYLGKCSVCHWNKLGGDRPCLGFSFDGVTGNTVEKFVKVEGKWIDSGLEYEMQYESYTPTPNRALRKRIVKILKAHILWGKRMMDGTYKKYAQEADHE